MACCRRVQNQEDLLIKASVTVHTATTLSLDLFKFLVSCQRIKVGLGRASPAKWRQESVDNSMKDIKDPPDPVGFL